MRRIRQTVCCHPLLTLPDTTYLAGSGGSRFLLETRGKVFVSGHDLRLSGGVPILAGPDQDRLPESSRRKQISIACAPQFSRRISFSSSSPATTFSKASPKKRIIRITQDRWRLLLLCIISPVLSFFPPHPPQGVVLCCLKRQGRPRVVIVVLVRTIYARATG